MQDGKPRRIGYGSKAWYEMRAQKLAEQGITPEDAASSTAGFQGFLLGLILGVFGVAVAFLFSSKQAERGSRTVGALIGAAIWFVLVSAIV